MAYKVYNNGEEAERKERMKEKQKGIKLQALKRMKGGTRQGNLPQTPGMDECAYYKQKGYWKKKCHQ